VQLLTTSTWVTLVAAALTAGAVSGQERPGAAAPPVWAAPEVNEPEANPLETPPAEPGRNGFGVDPFGGFGMGGRGLGGYGMGGYGTGGPGYRVTWYPARPVSGSGSQGDFGLLRQDFAAGVPLWHEGGDSLALSVGVRNSQFSTDAILPESHRAFPDELWNVRMGPNYLHKSDDGWSYGVGLSFGSASDKPFHSLDEMDFGFFSFLQIPARNERDAWRFMLMYSPVGNVNFPLPGLAYLWNPSATLHASIGLPPALLWQPVEDLTLNFIYLPLTTLNARATYRLVDKFFVFVGFESLQEAYFLADREDRSDRFMGFEKRLISGVRWDVGRHASLEASAGYAFDRYYGVGENWFRNLHDEVDIDPGPFVSASVRVRF
jgi:hypothetical protein